jgi:hypothetical protein
MDKDNMEVRGSKCFHTETLRGAIETAYEVCMSDFGTEHHCTGDQDRKRQLLDMGKGADELYQEILKLAKITPCPHCKED